MSEVAVVDVGTGNLFSVLRGLERAGAVPHRVSTPGDVRASPKIVFPGVGSFADVARRLSETGLGDAIRDAASKGALVLGICLGMQLLFEEGEEDGLSKGLGLIPGRVVGLRGGPGLAVPHMGWQKLDVARPSALVHGEGGWFYFSHSYRAETPDDFVLASVEHGERIPAVVGRGRVFGIQPHPEKSGADGHRFLTRFLRHT